MSTRFECRGLTGGWGQLTAFRDLDLAVEEGSMHAILGPNGAGKTTLLLTLAGLLPAHAGTVTVDGSQVPVPVDDTTMKRVAQLSGGTAYSASDLKGLEQVYKSLQDQIGYETVRGEASGGWLRLGAAFLAIAAIAALVINRRMPV